MKTECYADNFLRLVGACWRPVFSTSHHGFSLRSLYRKFQVFCAKFPSKITSMSALSPLCILFRVNAPLLFW